MSNIPDNLIYTEEHEWAKIENGEAFIGITDFAQSSLGDIVYLELPSKGSTILRSKSFGVVESIKSVSDLFSAFTGEIVDVNSNLVSTPEKLNHSPYENWLIKIKLSDTTETQTLLSPSNYKAHIDKA